MHSKIYPMSQVDASDTKIELTCSATKWVAMYMIDTMGREALEDFVYSTKMNLDYIMDSRNWISLDYYYRFLDRLVEYTKDPNAPFAAALYASSRACTRPFETLFMQLGTVQSTYRLFVNYSPRWSKVNTWTINEIEHEKAVISVRNHAHPQHKNNCLSIKGVLATMPRLFGLPLANVKEIECACDGAEKCVYEVRWIERPPRLWSSVSFFLGLGGGIVTGTYLGWGYIIYLLGLLMAAVGYLFARTLVYKKRLLDIYPRSEKQASDLHESIRSYELLNAKLQKNIEERTNALSVANKELMQALADLKASEEKLLVAEKQAALGVLAAGMAHEINNPVNAIRLSAQTMIEELQDGKKLKPQLEVIIRATERCRRIVNDVLYLSREPTQERHIRIDKIVDRAIDIFRSEHPGDVRIVRHFADDVPPLRLDSAQMQQVVMNLLINAADAMNNAGEIEITLAREDGNLALKIKDHGCGIKEEVRARIFDPFFTTKKPGRGMGLGLSITYHLVRRNGGTIDVESREGAGSTFIVKFPGSVWDAGVDVKT